VLKNKQIGYFSYRVVYGRSPLMKACSAAGLAEYLLGRYGKHVDERAVVVGVIDGYHGRREKKGENLRRQLLAGGQ